MEVHIECWNCGKVSRVVGQGTNPWYPEKLTVNDLAEAAFAAGFETYRDVWDRLLFFCSNECVEELVSKSADRSIPKERPIKTGTGRYPE